MTFRYDLIKGAKDVSFSTIFFPHWRHRCWWRATQNPLFSFSFVSDLYECVCVCGGSPGLQSGDIQRYSEASPAVPRQANTLTSAWHFPPAGSYPPASSASVYARCVRAVQHVCEISNSLSGSDSEEIAHRQLWVCKKKHIKLFSAACICMVYMCMNSVRPHFPQEITLKTCQLHVSKVKDKLKQEVLECFTARHCNWKKKKTILNVLFFSSKSWLMDFCFGSSWQVLLWKH